MLAPKLEFTSKLEFAPKLEFTPKDPKVSPPRLPLLDISLNTDSPILCSGLK